MGCYIDNHWAVIYYIIKVLFFINQLQQKRCVTTTKSKWFLVMVSLRPRPNSFVHCRKSHGPWLDNTLISIQVGKTTQFGEINISMTTPELVISIGNLWIWPVNDKILKNVINIHSNSQYAWRPVNGEPSNTFGTLELLFPISKKEFVLVLFQFRKIIVLVTFQLPSYIILVTFQKALLVFPSNFQNVSFLFHSNMDHSFMASLWFVYIKYSH